MKAKNLDTINRSFERQAENFESRKLAFSKQEYLDYTLKTVKPRKTDCILEVAAGTCVCGRSFASLVRSVTCLDATEAMLLVGRKEAERNQLDNMTFIKGCVEELPFLDDSFDIVFSRLAFHHFADVNVAFYEMKRVVDEDLFSLVVHHIVGQQISTKAQATIWQKMQAALGTIDANSISAATESELQAFGISFRKVAYIKDFAEKVCRGEFDIDGVARLSDDEAIKSLVSLKGIGVWTAEMILLFCLQRPNIFSYDDLAIQRGLRMVYHHRKITRKLFERYRRRFSPYCSVASLYLWAVAGGAIPEMKDYAVKK